MPAFDFRTARKGQSSKVGAIPAALLGLGNAVSDIVASIARGLAPPPVLRPIPVRVRDRQRYRD